MLLSTLGINVSQEERSSDGDLIPSHTCLFVLIIGHVFGMKPKNMQFS
jgi:hypothetical protein